MPGDRGWLRAVGSVVLMLAAGLCGVSALGQGGQPASQTGGTADLINPDRPGIADGSTVIGRGRFQIEAGLEKDFRSSAGSTEHQLFFPTLLRFGVSDRWEARVEAPNGYTRSRTSDPVAGVRRTDGYAPVSIGAKANFQPPDDARPYQPSLGAIVRLFVPSGSSDFGSHRFQADVRLAGDVNLTRSGDWTLNPNVGVGVYDDGASGTFAAGLLAVTLSRQNRAKTASLFLDMGLQTPEERHGKTAVTVDTGIAYIVDRNVQVDFSIGTGVLGRTPPHPFWAVGVSVRR